MKQKGETITCITTESKIVNIQDNGCAIYTYQKEYKVVNNENGYTIKNDSGGLYTFPYENFHTKQELRELKLEQLGI